MYSELWGQKGEKWSPTSRLPDFSFAGYRSGEKPIPMPEVKGNVKEFAAKGDGTTDDTKAFEDALAAVNNGAILVPAGRYVITRVLYIRKKYPGHWNEVGANGFWFNGVQNSRVRDITFHNSDNGVFFENSAFCTATGLKFTADPGRINIHTTAIYGSRALPFAGHHGLQSRYSEDCLFSDFRFDVYFVHDLTVENASGNVFHSGSSIDLNLDHHAQIPFDNLFTNLDMGSGSRPFNSGGGSPKAGVRNTFWNLKSTSQISPVNWPMMNFVGVPTSSSAATGATGRWIEPIAPASLEPKNIYLAQLERRLGKIPNAIQAGQSGPGRQRPESAGRRGASPLYRFEPTAPSASPGYYDSRGKRLEK